MGREHASRVVYHVFSMSFHLFFVFPKGGQRHMGVPCTGVRPCMAVPHKKLHIGSLLHHPNGSLCTDCVPQGLLTLWVAYVNTYLLSFNRRGPLYIGVPCKVVRPCIAVPHEKPQIGSLSHLSKACVWVGTCPSGCLPRVQHKLPPVYCVSIGRTAVHGGSMYTCLPMHGCPPWETTHPKFVPPFKCM